MMNKNIKQFHHIVILTVLMLIGYSITAMIFSLIQPDMENVFAVVSLWAHVRITFVAMIATLGLDMLLKIVLYRINRLKIQSVLFGPIAFIRKARFFIIRVNFQNAFKSGFAVIPQIPEVKDEDDMENVNKKLVKVSKHAGIGILILTVMLPMLTEFGGFIYFNVVLPQISVFIHMLYGVFLIDFTASACSTENYHGEFIDSVILKNSRLYALSEIYMLSEGKVAEMSEFLEKAIFEELRKSPLFDGRQWKDEIIISIVDKFLMKSLIGIDPENEIISSFCEHYASRPGLLVNEGSREAHKIFFVHLLYWLHKHDDPRLHELLPHMENLFKNRKVQKYYEMQIGQIIHGEDNRRYLSRKKSIRTTARYGALCVFDEYYHDELLLNA